MSLGYTMSKLVRERVYNILERYWGLRRGGDIRVVVRWGRYREMRAAMGLVEFIGWRKGVGWFRVVVNERAAESEGLLKGVCVHEALHIAYEYCAMVGDMDRFWEGVERAVQEGLERLRGDYANAEEFVVSVLEPIVALHLCPPPVVSADDEFGWVVVLGGG